MEYDFVYNSDTDQFSIRLAAEHEALGRFLLDEFGQQPMACQHLFEQLVQLTPYQSWQYQGKEYLLQIEQGEVTLSHNSLLADIDQPLPERLQDKLEGEDLQLDEQGLSMECGLEDLLKLVTEWQHFLAN